MRICPNCNKEVDDHNWTCPFCHQRLPRRNLPVTGHASIGDLDAYREKVTISVEDRNMIRDKNHMSSASVDDNAEDMDCDQPYSYVTRENGDRN